MDKLNRDMLEITLHDIEELAGDIRALLAETPKEAEPVKAEPSVQEMLKALRTMYSLRQLEDLLGVTQSAIQKIEKSGRTAKKHREDIERLYRETFKKQ